MSFQVGVIRLSIWVINFLGDLCFKIFGIKLCQINQDDILDDGEFLGLLDGKETKWIEPLTLLVRCYRTDKSLSTFGRRFIAAGLKGKLQVKTKIQERLLRDDSITKVPLRKPVFVLGVMRSGTTFLHGLLAQDPAFRPPLLYELLNPVPPETGAGTKDDPRIAAAERVPGLFQVIDPDFPSKHEIGATLPHECYHLFGPVGLIDKVAQLFCFNIPMYEKWWKKSLKREYMVEFYQDYKKALQMMTSQDEDVGHRRLLMKDHLHSLFSESLLEVFPDASFINPVRNPVDIVSSWCSVVDSLLPMTVNPGVITKFEIGRRVLEDIAYYTSTFLKYRKSCDQSGRQIRVIDVHQVDLVRDPITKVKEIYSYLGMELNSDVANKMAKYVAERKKSRKLQRHQHYCTDYGLTEKEILDKFQDYISYYKISV